MKKRKTIIHYLPVYGCMATGLIYAAIGTIAILSFLKVRHGGADEASMMAILAKYVIGKIVIWIILLGTLCYIVWRFYETFTDPYDYGKNWKGIIKRAGIALSTVADILIVYAAVLVLLGGAHFQTSGEPQEEQGMVHKMLNDQGQWPVIAIGLVYLATAVIQLWYGITRGYRERVDIERFSTFFRHTVHVLAWAGYAARGVILGIIGFFFIKAGVTENAQHIVNTDKAFDFIGDHVGHVYFILVAIATICYGLFMIAQGIAYDTDKD
jgi:heme/copper-type cytochrome/quinol oxidase subunit 2